MKIIVAGSGMVGLQLADRLDNATLIEADPAYYTVIKRQHPGIEIVGGDASHPDVLMRAGIENCSAIVIVTNKDYVNWKIALAVKEFSVPTVIARLRDESYRQNFREAGVTHIISPTEETISTILAEVFPTHETVTDILITEESPLAGRNASEIKLPSDTIIAAVRREDRLYRPTTQFVFRKGDSISLLSIGDIDIELYEAIAGNTSPYIPRSKVIFLLQSERDMKALGEIAFLCGRFRVSAEIAVGHKNSYLLRTAKNIMERAGVEFTFIHLDGDIYTGFRNHVRALEPDCGAVVAVHQAKRGLFRYEIPLNFMKSLIESSTASLIIARGNRYERVLHLLDSSVLGERCTRCSVSMAMDTSAKLYALCPHSTGSAEHDLVRLHTKRMSKIYGVDVIEDIVTGDPTIEFILKVRGKKDQLVIVNWKAILIKRDILNRIINDSEASVLVVGGQENF